MTCVKCRRKTGTNIAQIGEICQKCRYRILEDRIRKRITIAGIKKNDKVRIVNDEITIAMFKKIIGKLPLTIKISSKPIKGYKFVIAGKNQDELAEELMNCIITGKKIAKQKEIQIMQDISEADREFLAKKLGITIKKMKNTRIFQSCKQGLHQMKNTTLGKLLDKLETKYPGSKTGMLKQVMGYRK